jgi:hypothetical protein
MGMTAKNLSWVWALGMTLCTSLPLWSQDSRDVQASESHNAAKRTTAADSLHGAWHVNLGDSVSARHMPWDVEQILVMLPFGLDADTILGGTLSPKDQRLRDIALEHLHGIHIAAEALVQAGLNLRVKVVDELPDSTGSLRIGNVDIANSSLVMGPLMRESLTLVAGKVDRFGVEQLLLTEQPSHDIHGNLNTRHCVASDDVAIDLLADYILAQHDTDHVVMLRTGSSDAALEAHFTHRFNEAQRAKCLLPADSLKFRGLVVVEGSPRSVGALSDHVTPYERNVIVSVSGRASRSMWAALQTELQMNDSSDIVVFGHPEVADFPFMEGDLMAKWRLCVPSQGTPNLADSLARSSWMAYRVAFGTEPGKYAVLAHDALVNAMVRRHPWVAGFVHPMAHDFQWVRPEGGGAWHNGDWTMRRFVDMAWLPTDTLPELAPFVPRKFFDGDGEELPVPLKYQHVFPEE